MGPVYRAAKALLQRKILSINLFFKWEKEQRFFVALACVMDWSSESSKECQMHCTDKAGGQERREWGGGDAEAD